MSEHLSPKQFHDYVNRTMEPAQLLQTDDHLSGCDLCHTQLASFESARGSFDFFLRTVADLEHLTYEQLESYVDGKSDDVEKEIVDVHVENCSACSQELGGLFEMRALINRDVHRREVTRREPVFASVRSFF